MKPEIRYMSPEEQLKVLMTTRIDQEFSAIFDQTPVAEKFREAFENVRLEGTEDNFREFMQVLVFKQVCGNDPYTIVRYMSIAEQENVTFSVEEEDSEYDDEYTPYMVKLTPHLDS